jgi:hypothetical protein
MPAIGADFHRRGSGETINFFVIALFNRLNKSQATTGGIPRKYSHRIIPGTTHVHISVIRTNGHFSRPG